MRRRWRRGWGSASRSSVDGARRLGGLCILKGCMPSKTLIYTAEVLHRAQHARELGLKIPRARADPKAILARKDRIIDGFADHRSRQIRNGDFALYRSNAHFIDPHTVELADGRKLRARHFLIATGSKVSVPDVPGLKETRCWTSDEVLDLDFVPRSVMVLGGGCRGLRTRAIPPSRRRARSTMLQRSRHILRSHSAEASEVGGEGVPGRGDRTVDGGEDREGRSEGRSSRSGLRPDVALRGSAGRSASGVRVSFIHQGKKMTRTADHCFNALGREANISGLNLEAAGVRTKANRRVVTNRWRADLGAAHLRRGRLLGASGDRAHRGPARANSRPGMPRA